MPVQKALLRILICLLFVHVTGTAYSNDTPIMSVGKAIQPRTDVPVRLVSELVEITLDKDKAFVSCTFNLLNEGPPDTIDVGFPRGGESDLLDFVAAIGLDTLEVETVSSVPVYVDPYKKELPWWKTFKVPFTEKGQTVEVNNSYWTPVLHSTHTKLSNHWFTYIMTTGANWKGVIGDATFIVTIKNINQSQIVKVTPKNYVTENNTFIWRFTDFEPDRNIEIFYMHEKVYSVW